MSMYRVNEQILRAKGQNIVISQSSVRFILTYRLLTQDWVFWGWYCFQGLCKFKSVYSWSEFIS